MMKKSFNTNLLYHHRSGYRKWLVIALSAGLLIQSSLQAGQRPVNIKMASLAPEGSPWHQVLQEIAQDWRDLSNNQVRLQIYAGGVIGDESDMVRKMRLSQVQAAALTAEGLSYIDKGIYGLSLPLLVDNYAELDWLRAQLEPELRRRYEEKEFIVLAWADVGWAYWFTRKPTKTPDDLRKQRIFTWAGDPHSPRLWKTAGFQAVSLSAMDVLPGLQTGLIDAVQSSPLTVASFQWFGIIKYMTNLPWAAMTGGLIINSKSWNRIPENLRPRLRAAVRKRTLRIKNQIRYTDDEAVAVMQEHGLEIVDITEDERAQWQQFVDRYGPILRGTLVDTAMYDQIQALRREMDRPDFTLPEEGSGNQ
ncbi:MAG: TRAP transporter substrate-binding protein DctP [Fidelibacterota bacterium]|nr:MAG: TRAP transporter substrate-binding protein DctP [Candidatus Neomarinimicrobiota bacterium]